MVGAFVNGGENTLSDVFLVSKRVLSRDCANICLEQTYAFGLNLATIKFEFGSVARKGCKLV